MWKFIVRRALSGLVVLLGVSILTFSLTFFTPGDPARTILRQQMGGRSPSQEAIERFRETNGLNDPIPVQYVNWITDVVQGDLGVSYHSSTPVMTLIQQNVMPTVELAVAGLLVALVISIPTGVISAVHKGGRLDYGSQVLALLGLSMPNF